MALFVVSLGMSPRDYWSLTVMERDAIVEAHKEANRK